VTTLRIVASLPAPPSNDIGVGPIQLRAYGIMIAAGVITAVVIAQRRWQRAGGDRGDIGSLAAWAVPAGLVGARIWHVLTDAQRFEGRWLHVFAVWEGGLGIPGGLLGGVLAGVWVGHRRSSPVARLLDAVAPAIPVAQAIGRVGNWFNQELFGRPTRLPWGLEVDPGKRPARYADATTFHPTFLYEALWNLALAAAIVWIGTRWRLRPGQLFTVYVAGYAIGRVWVEALRADPAALLFGVRFNLLFSVVVAVAALVTFVIRSRGTASSASQPDALA
jgi:prolipoprotein diacylglyceryl transferase